MLGQLQNSQPVAWKNPVKAQATPDYRRQFETDTHRTWQYVNKRGGPDRRFKNNRQLPVCLYNELSLQSASGLNELIQLSKADIAEGFVKAIDGLAKRFQ